MYKIMTLALSLCFCVFLAQNTQAASGPDAPLAENPEQTEAIINEAAQNAGLTAAFGNPAWMMEAENAQADVLVEFPNGPIPDLAAAEFGLLACARLAEAGADFQRLGLTVTSPLPDGRLRVYGTAIFNGNLEALVWENTGMNLDRAAGPRIAKNAPTPPPVREEVIEEVIVVGPDGKLVPQDGPKPQFGQPMLQPKGQGRPPLSQNLPPMAQGRGETGCPYLDGQAAVQPPVPGQPPLPGRQLPPLSSPQPGCPYLQGLNLRTPKTLIEEENPALASYAVNAQTLLNDTAAETGLQDIFGNPVVFMDAQNKNVELMVQFRNGPIPPESARLYGEEACRNLARAWVVKGLGVQRLTITVTSLLPHGGMMIYGTAIYNGSLGDISWQKFGLAVGPENMRPPYPPSPQPLPDMRPGMPGNIQPGTQPVVPSQPGIAPSQRRPIRVMPAPAQSDPGTVPAPDAQLPPPPPAPGARQAPALPDMKSFPTRPETPREEALDNANGANEASYSLPVTSLVNGVVRALGLQSTYGLPECSVAAANKQADILVQFSRGPMPESSAAALGLQACEQLARAYVVKGFGPKRVTITVCYNTDKGRYDYGTAIFEGKLDSIVWVAVGRMI